MFIDYIQAAMRRAKYEVLEDHEGFVGTIPGFKGLLAHAETLEACREELQDVLQSWMLVRMDHRLRLPVIEGLDLNPGRVSHRSKSGGGRRRKVA
jgi:predicted RNase H-like HicB family nuclease